MTRMIHYVRKTIVLLLSLFVLVFSIELTPCLAQAPIIINEGAFTNLSTVTLTLNINSVFTSTGVETQVAIYEIQPTTLQWEPYETTKTWLLSEGDGLKTIYVVFRTGDPIESIYTTSNVSTTSITLDTVPPVLSITGPDSSSQIGSQTQQITWTAADSGSGISYNEVIFPNGNAVNVEKETTYTLADLTNGNYEFTVNSYDNAGNRATATSGFVVNILEEPAPTPTHSDEGQNLDSDIIIIIILALLAIAGAVAGSYILLRRRRKKSYDFKKAKSQPAMQQPDQREYLSPPPPKLRWIQSQVFEVLRTGKKIRQINALRASALHWLVLRVGAADETWLTPSAEEAFFPEDKLEWKKEFSNLQVVFSEPNHCPVPQIGKIVLPRYGSSTTCQFPFTPRQDKPYFRGRVIILEGNRVLQTALLEGKVLPNPEQFPELKLSFEIESIIQPNLNDLSNRRAFDLAFVANHTIDKSPALTTIAGDKALFNSLKGIESPIKEITKTLENVVKYPENYSIEQNNTQWLTDLALNGKQLFDGIVVDQIGKLKLLNINRIQLVSTVEEYLPLEFVYDMPAPRFNAALCIRWREALEEGACHGCKYKNAFAPVDYVCPLGFWGLRLIIERHYLDPYCKPDLGSYAFALKGEGVEGRKAIRVLKSAIFASSDRVDMVNKAGVKSKETFAALKDATHQRVEQVSTLEQWKQAIVRLEPSLIVLLTHISPCAEDPRQAQMEIGQGIGLPQPYISWKYVLPSENAPRPVVLLLGCTTMTTAIPFRSFAASFRREGAAIVLSTITQVLGRQVAPISALLVTSLEQAAKKGLGFGDALLLVRRKAMASGIPMVLSLVGIGDADWRLEGE